MSVLSLDLSTKTGWAYFDDDKSLVECGTLFVEKKECDTKEAWPFGDEYPWNYLHRARAVIDNIDTVVKRFTPDTIVIEETTSGANNYSQKILEFIHHDLLMWLSIVAPRPEIKYVRTQVWRSVVGAKQSDEEKKWNAKIGRIKKKTGKRLAKIDGKVVRKMDRKDYALRAFKEHFGFELDRKMNDACDAALVGLAYIKGCPVCDGTPKGGTLKDL